MSGLDVAQRVAGRCHVAFISAYDQHAIAAFEAGGVDYVLKPVAAARLATTVERLKGRLGMATPDLQQRPAAARGRRRRRRHSATCNGSTPRAARRSS